MEKGKSSLQPPIDPIKEERPEFFPKDQNDRPLQEVETTPSEQIFLNGQYYQLIRDAAPLQAWQPSTPAEVVPAPTTPTGVMPPSATAAGIMPPFAASSGVVRSPTVGVKYFDGKTCGLPEGWMVEKRPRDNPKYLGKIDQFFDHLESGKRFRSLKAAKQWIADQNLASEASQASQRSNP